MMSSGEERKHVATSRGTGRLSVVVNGARVLGRLGLFSVGMLVCWDAGGVSQGPKDPRTQATKDGLVDDGRRRGGHWRKVSGPPA